MFVPFYRYGSDDKRMAFKELLKGRLANKIKTYFCCLKDVYLVINNNTIIIFTNNNYREYIFPKYNFVNQLSLEPFRLKWSGYTVYIIPFEFEGKKYFTFTTPTDANFYTNELIHAVRILNPELTHEIIDEDVHISIKVLSIFRQTSPIYKEGYCITFVDKHDVIDFCKRHNLNTESIFTPTIEFISQIDDFTNLNKLNTLLKDLDERMGTVNYNKYHSSIEGIIQGNNIYTFTECLALKHGEVRPENARTKEGKEYWSNYKKILSETKVNCMGLIHPNLMKIYNIVKEKYVNVIIVTGPIQVDLISICIDIHNSNDKICWIDSCTSSNDIIVWRTVKSICRGEVPLVSSYNINFIYKLSSIILIMTGQYTRYTSLILNIELYNEYSKLMTSPINKVKCLKSYSNKRHIEYLKLSSTSIYTNVNDLITGINIINNLNCINTVYVNEIYKTCIVYDLYDKPVEEIIIKDFSLNLMPYDLNQITEGTVSEGVYYELICRFNKFELITIGEMVIVLTPGYFHKFNAFDIIPELNTGTKTIIINGYTFKVVDRMKVKLNDTEEYCTVYK